MVEKAATAITLDINTLLIAFLAVLTLVINGPIAWILRSVSKEQKRLDQDHEKLSDDHAEFKEKVNDQFVKEKDLNRRLDQVSSDISEIKNGQSTIVKLLMKVEKE